MYTDHEREQTSYQETVKTEAVNREISYCEQKPTSPSEGMSTDNNTGIQTRAMAKAQCIESEANPEQAQGTPNPATNPTVDLHRTKEEAIEEFV